MTPPVIASPTPSMPETMRPPSPAHHGASVAQRRDTVLTRAHDPHRPSRRLLQPRAWRAPSHQPRRDRSAGAGRGVVAGLARQPTEAKSGHGALAGAAVVGAAASPRRADPGHRDRARAGHRLHGGHAGGAGPPLPRAALRLADGRRLPRPVPPLARLAE